MLDAGFLTLDRLKSRLLPDEQESRTQWDDDIREIGMGVVESFNMYCNRVFPRTVGAFYSVSADRSSLCLDALPVESIQSISVRYGESDETEEQTTDISDSVISLGRKSGIAEFGYILGDYYERVEVIFTGGYWLAGSDDDAVQPPGSTRLPSDIMRAYVRQCQAECEHSNLFHTAALRRADREATESKIEQLDLLPSVIKTLKRYHRYA